MSQSNYGGGGGGLLVGGAGPGSDNCVGEGYGGGACATVVKTFWQWLFHLRGDCVVDDPKPGVVLLEFQN